MIRIGSIFDGIRRGDHPRLFTNGRHGFLRQSMRILSVLSEWRRRERVFVVKIAGKLAYVEWRRSETEGVWRAIDEAVFSPQFKDLVDASIARWLVYPQGAGVDS